MSKFYDWLLEFLQGQSVGFQMIGSNSIYIPEIDKTLIYTHFYEKGSFEQDVINIWEDWWLYKPEILKSKIKSKLNLLNRIPARLCRVKRIANPEANHFLSQNHLLGPSKSKIKYGIFLPEKYFRVLPERPKGDELMVGVMTFSGQRVFRDGSISYELVRYATLNGFSIQGGFSKCLTTFIKEKLPDSIMTYADKDWYSGNFYEKLGFAQTGYFDSSYFKVNDNGDRIKVGEESEAQVRNKGSIKMLWEKK